MMAFRINRSYLTATIVLVGIGVWMGTGTLRIGGQATASAEAQSIAERQESTLQTVAVRVKTLQASDRRRELEIRGRTQADATISVRAETSGIIAERFVELGQHWMLRKRFFRNLNWSWAGLKSVLPYQALSRSLWPKVVICCPLVESAQP